MKNRLLEPSKNEGGMKTEIFLQQGTHTGGAKTKAITSTSNNLQIKEDKAMELSEVNTASKQDGVLQSIKRRISNVKSKGMPLKDICTKFSVYYFAYYI